MTATLRTLPTAAANDAGVGTEAWSNPTNVLTSNDVRAIAALANSELSNWLTATGFNFTIPVDARIDGVKVEIEGQANAANLSIFQVRLVLGGTVASVGSLVSNALLNGTDSSFFYGGDTDTWRQLLTPAVVNNSGFGVAVQCRNFSGGAAEARIDAIWITVYYSRPDGGQTIVTLRSGRALHASRIHVVPSALRYSYKVRGMGQASFLIPKTHSQIRDIGRMLQDDDPPMITIRPPDGNLQWVGYYNGLVDTDGDPFLQINCADHFVKLADSYTPQSGGTTTPQASGYLLRDTLSKMGGIDMGVGNISPGPPMSYQYKLDSGEKLVRAAEDQTGWESYFQYEISDEDVITTLGWTQRQGADRRNEEVWQDAKHFTRRGYSTAPRKGFSASIAVGGNGAFSSRTAASVSKSGANVGTISGSKRVGTQGPGFGGTLVTIEPQTTDASSLKQMAQARLDAPENASEKLSMVLFEKAINRDTLALGDIRRIRYTFLEEDQDRDVRIIGLQVAADTGLIEVESVVLAND